MTQEENQQAENQQIVLAYVEAFNSGDTQALRQLFAPDALVYGVLGWGGLDEVIPVWQQLHESFAFQLHVEALVAQGDTVVARFMERGTSVVAFRGQAATGKSSEVVAIEWFMIKNGRISRRWGVRDSASHFRQMQFSLA